MKSPFDDSQLREVAAKLASQNARDSRTSFIARSVARIKSELLEGSPRRKLRFVRFAVREGLAKLLKYVIPSDHREIRAEPPPDRLLVAIRCNGCLGDLIIHSSFIDRFYREFGRPIINVIVRSERLPEAGFAFHDSPAVALVTDAADCRPSTTPYDVVLSLAEFASYDFVRTTRVKRIAPEVLDKIEAARQIQLPYRAFIDAQPSFDGLFATAATQFGLRRLDLLGWLANVEFTQNHPLLACPDAAGYRLFKNLGLAQRPYVTIHNGWDNVTHRNTTNATKGWPVAYYERFVAGFKERFPGLAVVQLGAKTSRPIAGTDINLLNDTTLHEAAWILKHSLLHVDGDSGLVHLARALHTKSLVLFGPTNHDFFRYEQNETCFSTNCNNCWWSTHDWMRSCPRGFDEPICMKSIEPSTVLDMAGRDLLSRSTTQLKVVHAASWQSPEDGSFDEWRNRLVLKALCSAQVADLFLRVAVIDDPNSSSSKYAAAGRQITTFAFNQERDRSAKPACDYGSLYNVPAENATFDVVVMPVLTANTVYAYAAIKESLRLLKVNGLLVMSYQFSNRGKDSTYALRHALECLGVAEPPLRAAAGAAVCEIGQIASRPGRGRSASVPCVSLARREIPA
jgi:hypothetical protein